MTDTIHLIDRYKSSPAYGVQVMQFIPLIDKPRAGYLPKHITGAVGHGQEVEVIEKKQAHDDIWCLVACDIEHEGETLHQEGWLKRQMLEVEGESYFGQEWNA